MSTRATSITISYQAWDTSANAGKTGDSGNHTLRWVKDGTSSAPANSPAEVDATNCPGLYKLVLTGTECTCDYGTLHGKSSTANISIMPISVSFEAATPDNASIAAVKVQTDKLAFTVANQVDANVIDWKSSVAPAMTGDAFARLGAPAGASVSADVAAVKSDSAAIKAKTDNLPAAPAAVSDIPTAVQNADALLGRNIAGGSSAGRLVKDALRFLRNKWTIAAGTLTVYQEDDSTSAWTAAVSTDASAVPIVGNDPA